MCVRVCVKSLSCLCPSVMPGSVLLDLCRRFSSACFLAGYMSVFLFLS